MRATMARADRSARAEIMTSLASSMRSLFLARKARPHRAPAPADVRDYEEKRRQRTHRLRIFAFSRLESVGDRRRGTTRADIVGSQPGAPRCRSGAAVEPDKVDNERSHRLVLHSISQQRIVRMTVAVDLQSPSSISAENPAGRSGETPTSILRRRWSPTPRVVEAAKTSGLPAGIPA